MLNSCATSGVTSGTAVASAVGVTSIAASFAAYVLGLKFNAILIYLRFSAVNGIKPYPAGEYSLVYVTVNRKVHCNGLDHNVLSIWIYKIISCP